MGAHILIIDDDGSFRKILERRIRSFMTGVIITQFESLTATREFLKTNDGYSFDLVILDQRLPDGTGAMFLKEGWFRELAVLAVSSDDAPELPGETMTAGATFFLPKTEVGQALFEPLVRGLIDRNRIQKEYEQTKIHATRMETVKKLVATLRHEINNPLGAVLGAAYLLRSDKNASPEQKEAATLVEASGSRIKHVLQEIAAATELEEVQKGPEKVFHVPGDAAWGAKGKSKAPSPEKK